MDGVSEGRGAWRSRYPLLKLSPPIEEEEGPATRVVDQGNVVEAVELDLDEYNTLADAVNEGAMNGTHGAEEMDIEITDDEDQGGDDDSAVGGIMRRRTIRVVIRSRAFL